MASLEENVRQTFIPGFSAGIQQLPEITLDESEEKEKQEVTQTSLTPNQKDIQSHRSEHLSSFDFSALRKTLISYTEKTLQAVNPPWDKSKDLKVYERQLEKGQFLEIIGMREYLQGKKGIAKFAGEVYLVLLDNGTKAVWKPRDGEGMQAALCEVAAFKASLWLAKHTHRYLVPPTILKTYKGHTGSLQWFVESELDLWVDSDRALGFSTLDSGDLAYTAAFIQIFGQWDVHPGNYLMPQDAKKQSILALIDNECITNRKYSRAADERPYIRFAYSEALEKDREAEPKFVKLKTPTREQLAQELHVFNFEKGRLDRLYENLSENGSLDINFMIWKSSLWVQYHQYNKKAFPNFVAHYPEWVLEAYAKLTLKDLKEDIFAMGVEAFPEHFNQDFFTDILIRRDQALQAAALKSNTTLARI